VGRTVRAPGADGPRVIEIYLISKVISNVFSRKIASGRTVRGSMADNPLLTSKLERTVCSSGGSRGQSAACLRTVHGAQADSPRGPGGQSARPNGHHCQLLTSHFYHWKNSNVDSP
jgi:hypothetical protein